jgi:hypothetical protein
MKWPQNTSQMGGEYIEGLLLKEILFRLPIVDLWICQLSREGLGVEESDCWSLA